VYSSNVKIFASTGCKMKMYKLQEPVKSKMIEFLIKRIHKLKNRKKSNKSATGRLIDLIQLIVADLPFTDPPVFIKRKIEEFESERKSNGEL